MIFGEESLPKLLWWVLDTMRANLVLALVFVVSGFALCTISFVLLNVQIPQEPFSLWSELPYVGMFHYAGIVCLAGAILFLLMDRLENIIMNIVNLVVISVVVLANFVSFFFGGYQALLPILFLLGLLGTSIVSAWSAIRMDTRDLMTLVVIATLVAAVDEYAHTSAGTLSYFDNAVPSPLTVSGWGLFIILIVTVAGVLARSRTLDIREQKRIRTFPFFASAILVGSVAVLQGYISVFNWALIAVYAMLVLGSLYYTYTHSLKWNLMLMASSLLFGFSMEYMGRWEGLWTFRFMEPISLLILFSWPLRIWTVNAFCTFFGADFSKDNS